MAKIKADEKAKAEEASEKIKAKGKPDNAEEGEEGETAETPAKAKRPLKFWLMWVAAPAVLAVALAGAGAYFFLSGGDEGIQTVQGEAPVAAAAPAAAFYDLPEILVNLNGEEGKPVYLKLNVALELDQAGTKQAIEPLMPRVLDNFQVYLRELRLDDLQGSAGMFRLKEELVRRVNLAIAPASVRDVLFKEMIVQ